MAQAWLTPDQDNLEESQVERTIKLPGSLWYLVSGALDLLAQAENWEEFGDATPEDAAQFFADVLDDYAMSSFRNVGMIAAFPSIASIPDMWLVLQGQTVAEDDYPELAAKVPAWVSGSDIVLPDARNRFMVGGAGGIPVGNTGGSNTHTLTTAQMPNHTHIYREDQTTVLAAAGALPVQGPIVNSPTTAAGSGQSHNNMPLYLSILWCVYAGR